MILPGEPTTKELSGMTLFSVIKALAPIIQFLPILALFRITAPILLSNGISRIVSKEVLIAL